MAAYTKVAQLPLPEFSSVVRSFLEGTEEVPRGIWLTAVKEAALFYLREYPNLKESNIYQSIGMRVFARYPRIGCSGKKPWVSLQAWSLSLSSSDVIPSG